MPRGNVAGTGSGSERWACDHRVCLFELWSPEISGPGTSAYYRKTLAGGTMTEQKPLTYNEQTGRWSGLSWVSARAGETDSAEQLRFLTI